MTNQNTPYELDADEKVTPTMVYTTQNMVWGDMRSKKVIEVSNWLKRSIIPDTFVMYNATMLVLGGAKPTRLKLQEIYIPITEILAMHELNRTEPFIDYDPDEPNRKMEPLSALVGFYRFDGFFRISALTSLTSAIESGKEDYISLYDVTVSHPSVPSMKAMHASYTLVRKKDTILAKR